MTAYTFAQLEQIWIAAGGNPQKASYAAAVAMAESSGNPQATNHNTNGSWDMGLWQINMSSRDTSWFDTTKNAREAIRQSKNGTNWRPWCTAYSDGACGTKGGSYSLTNSPAGKYAKQNGGVSPASTGPNPLDSLSPAGSLFDWLQNNASPERWVSQLFKTVLAPLVNMIAIVLELGAGAFLMGFGVWMIVLSNPSVRKTAMQVGQTAAMAAV